MDEIDAKINSGIPDHISERSQDTSVPGIILIL